MIEILKNYGEYIVGIPSLIIASLISIWVFKKQKSKKSLTYIVDSYYDLISEKIKESSLQIFFNKKEYKNVSTLLLEIRNNGSIPIEPDDFVKGFKIIFSIGTEILEVSVNKKYPENMEIDSFIKENILTIKPYLLNKDEFFKLKFLLGNNSSFDFDTRIKGISEINKTESKKYNLRSFLREFMSDNIVKYTFVVIILLLLSAFQFGRFSYELINDSFSKYLFITSIIPFIISIFIWIFFDKLISKRKII